MKTGKKLFGPIIMTVMMALAISSIIVSAFVLSNTLTVNRSIHDGVTIGTSGDITTFTGGANEKPNMPAVDLFSNTQYDFGVAVPIITEACTMTFTITGTGVLDAESVDMWSNNAGATWNVMTPSGTTTLVFTFAIPVASATTYGFSIEFYDAGDIVMTITLDA